MDLTSLHAVRREELDPWPCIAVLTLVRHTALVHHKNVPIRKLRVGAARSKALRVASQQLNLRAAAHGQREAAARRNALARKVKHMRNKIAFQIAHGFGNAHKRIR